MKKGAYILLFAIWLTGCATRQMPPFGSGVGWTLQGSTVANQDISVDFGGDGILANASDG